MLRNACCEDVRGEYEIVNENWKDKHFFLSHQDGDTRK